MPKKSFKSNTSTVFVKSKKRCQIIRNNGLDKRCSKFILVDGNNEKNWKALKTESECKSDASFLEYLLALAQKDLDSTRKKIISSSVRDTKVKPVAKSCAKNVKSIVNGNAASDSAKLGAASDEMEETEEKMNLLSKPIVNKRHVSVEKNKIIHKVLIARKIYLHEADQHKDEKSSLLIDADPNTLTEKSKILDENIKTEIAKDIVLGNKSINVSRMIGDVTDEPAVSESCIKSDCKFKESCGDSVDDLSERKKHFKRKTRKKKGDSEPERCKSKRNLSEKDSSPRVAIKIKLCLLCNTSHVVGECSTTVEKETGSAFSVFSQPQDFSPEVSSEEYVYDFNESKQERNESEEMQELSSCSDSSDSETKLRIDESFGENISFAESSLPDNLELKVLDVEHGPSVFAKNLLKKGAQLGSLMGQKIKEMDIPDDFDMKHIWEIDSGKDTTYLSTRDPETSNWLRYIRPAGTKESANIFGATKDGKLWFSLTEDVLEGEELVYWTEDVHSTWSKKKMEKKNCGGCNLRFAHPLYYRKHCMIFHDPSCSLTIRKYHCKVCGVAVLGKEKIMKHAAEMHQGRGAYQCQFCHKFFLRLNYLEMHRTYGCSKNPQRSRPLCDLCGRKFCQPQKLKVHIKRMHSDMAQVLKDFQCKSCLKILGSRAALQRHMKEVHNKDIVGACTCDRCGKMFQNKSNLKIHMLTHSGVKPFKCQQSDCTAAFTTKQCLQFHYKKVHGFADGFIPRIERSIAYTFDAYSGGAVSDLDFGKSPKSEGRSESPPGDPSRDRGLDLSLVSPVEENFRGNKSASPASVRFESCVSANVEDTSIDVKVQKCAVRRESMEMPTSKSIPSKGSKKWIEGGFKCIFKPENSDASLLVEAAISAAEKDIIPNRYVKEPVASDQILNASDIYYVNGSPQVVECDKSPSSSPKSIKKSNFNDILKCNSLPRANEVPKDYASASVRDHEESFNDIDIHDYRNRDLLETYKENDGFHEQYRSHDFYRSDKPEYADSDFRPSSADKYRDADLSAECYRNLEKYRNADVYRLRSEVYDFEGAYRDAQEGEGQVQNLCLKEKSLQYETLEELARIGRDNPGFECLLVGDPSNTNQNSGLPIPRGLHGMPSPRSYHPGPYETESVDLSVPRPSYSSPPIYSLDLTPTRLELPVSRPGDLRSHLGLSPHRFSNARVSVNVSSPASPTDYSIYPSPFVAAAARPSPTSQFQPYTSLYY